MRETMTMKQKFGTAIVGHWSLVVGHWLSVNSLHGCDKAVRYETLVGLKLL